MVGTFNNSVPEMVSLPEAIQQKVPQIHPTIHGTPLERPWQGVVGLRVPRAA